MPNKHSKLAVDDRVVWRGKPATVTDLCARVGWYYIHVDGDEAVVRWVVSRSTLTPAKEGV
jgi:hypothetical protein